LTDQVSPAVELDPNRQYYLHCKAGVRSLKALNCLRQQGFKYLKSINAGGEAIDSSMPRYRVVANDPL
jgi:adenylyltransferase/sulfurtransferase